MLRRTRQRRACSRTQLLEVNTSSVQSKRWRRTANVYNRRPADRAPLSRACGNPAKLRLLTVQPTAAAAAAVTYWDVDVRSWPPGCSAARTCRQLNLYSSRSPPHDRLNLSHGRHSPPISRRARARRCPSSVRPPAALIISRWTGLVRQPASSIAAQLKDQRWRLAGGACCCRWSTTFISDRPLCVVASLITQLERRSLSHCTTNDRHTVSSITQPSVAAATAIRLRRRTGVQIRISVKLKTSLFEKYDDFIFE